MRRRQLIWLVMGLLALAVIGRWRYHSVQLRQPGRSVPSLQSALTSASLAQPLPPISHPAKTSDNPHFPHRLRNTQEPIGSLLRKDTALLLENAFFDTALPLEVPIPDLLRAKGNPGAYLVQSTSSPDAAFRSVLAAAGVRIVSYIPNNAFLVQASSETANELRSSPQVQAVLPFEPYYKLKASLLDQVLAGQPADIPLHILIFEGSRAETMLKLQQFNILYTAEYGSPFGPVVEIHCPVAKAAEIAALPGVQELEIAHHPVPASDLSRATLGVTTNSTTPSPYLGLTGSNMVVQVMDTGVDASHPALQGRVFTQSTLGSVDTNGHGTHIAGLIAGDGADSATVTNAPGSSLPAVPGQFRGIAPGSRVLSTPFEPGAANFSISGSLQAAALTNAVVSNNSWNYGKDYEYDLTAAIFDAATRDAAPSASGPQPLLCVFSAGNSGPGSGVEEFAGFVQSPATAKNVITVGAIEQPRFVTNQTWTCIGSTCETNRPWLPLTDSNSEVADFSSRGNVGIGTEGEFGRFKPDLVAPGTFVLSARSGQWDKAAYYALSNVWMVASPDANYSMGLSNLNEAAGPFYRFESGTSVAAAEISGVAALIGDFFASRFALTNSPALTKALLINGARPLGDYDLAAQTQTNAQGWGLVQLPTTVPAVLTNQEGAGTSMFFDEQSSTRSLSTGSSETLFLTVRPQARSHPLRITLAWTDPPANPLAGIKLVNDLDLIVTNLVTGDVYFGNNIPAGQRFSSPSILATDSFDRLNNVENVLLPSLLSSSYSVTVHGRAIRVNAVTALNGVLQDYALVISSGDGEVSDALTVTRTAPVVAAATSVTWLTNQFSASPSEFGCVLAAQRIGADAPFISSNSVPLNGTAGFINLGSMNQWRFYVFTNDTTFTNAAFATFLTSSVAGGLSAASASAHVDIDLYVSTDSSLTNLDPNAVALADKSLGREGSELLTYTNALPGVYYIGVKCESQNAAEYTLAAVVSEEPFAQVDSVGNQILRAVPATAPIPAAGQALQLFFPSSDLMLRRLVVSNVIDHPALNEVQAVLSHGPYASTLLNFSNHLAGAFVFDDSGEGDIPGAEPSDGPGDLRAFAGTDGAGIWLLEVTSTNRSGVTGPVSLLLERQQDLLQGSGPVVLPGKCLQEYAFVVRACTNLQVWVTLASGAGPISVQVFPTNLVPAQAALQTLGSQGETAPFSFDNTSIPPLADGNYVVRICNGGSDPASISILAAEAIDPAGEPMVRFNSAGPMPILDDAVSVSAILVTNQLAVGSLNAAVRIHHPRVSDLVLTLVSPSGTRVLLQDGRGGSSSEGMGSVVIETNMTSVTWSGGSEAFTNTLETGEVAGSLHVVYDFLQLPDQMIIYYENTLVFDSGMVSGGLTNDFPFGPGNSTFVTIVMNPNGNPDTDTAWFYRVSSTHPVPVYFTFTEDTNSAALPIKFAPTPFTNLTSSAAGTIPAAIAYAPEESLEKFRGEPAAGIWKLEVQDTRAGAVNPTPALLGWRLDMSLRSSVPAPVAMVSGLPWTNILAPHQIQWFAVTVPPWTSFATNQLIFADPGINLLFNPATPPTGTNAQDSILLADSHGGAVVLTTNGTSSMTPGSHYFLGVQNTNFTTVSYGLSVDFDVATVVNLEAGTPYAAVSGAQDFYQFVVGSNSARVQFEINAPSVDVTLVVRRGLPLPTLTSFDFISANPGLADEVVVVRDSSSPVALAPGPWFLGVYNPWGLPASYSLVVNEYTNSGTNLSIAGPVVTNGSFCLSWNSVPNAYYFVEGTTNLSSPNWTVLAQGLRASDINTTFCVPLPSAFQFFRVSEGLSPEVAPLRITSIAKSAQGVLLRWSANRDLVFRVEWSSSLAQPGWHSFSNAVSSVSSVFEFRDDNSQTGGSGSTRFYRIVQVQ